MHAAVTAKVSATAKKNIKIQGKHAAISRVVVFGTCG